MIEGGARGSASGLRKGVPPLTLSRDWVERTFMMCARVYAGISLLRERPEGMKTGETCGRPLDCFARPPEVTIWLCLLF